MNQIKFGTDGWRARMGEAYTFPNVRRVSRALNALLNEDGVQGAKIPVGHDCRFQGEEYARTVAACLAEAGHQPVIHPGPVATPVVSYVTREWQAPFGVMVTASHNPALDNGIKIKANYGGSASPEFTARLEQALAAQGDEAAAPVTLEGWSEGDLTGGYEDFIENLLDLEAIRAMDGLVIADAMHGVAGRRLEEKASGGKLQVQTIRAERDAWFGGVAPEPIPKYLQPLMEEVPKRGALLGLVTDGDGDRSGVVGADGAFVSPLELISILSLYLLEQRGLKGALCRTNAGTCYLEWIAEEFDLPFYNEPVGFKYIAERMMNEEVLIGGEESGGISFQGYLPERDGILINLLLLEALSRRGSTLAEEMANLRKRYGDYRYTRSDLAMPREESSRKLEALLSAPPEKIQGVKVDRTDTTDGLKLVFEDRSWVLFRASGTEPKVRIYAEVRAPMEPAKAVAEAVDIFKSL